MAPLAPALRPASACFAARAARARRILPGLGEAARLTAHATAWRKDLIRLVSSRKGVQVYWQRPPDHEQLSHPLRGPHAAPHLKEGQAMPLFGERNGVAALRFWRQPGSNTRDVGQFLAGTKPCVIGFPCPEEGFYILPGRPGEDMAARGAAAAISVHTHKEDGCIGSQRPRVARAHSARQHLD